MNELKYCWRRDGMLENVPRRGFLRMAALGATGVAGCLDQGPPEYDAEAFLEGEEELADHRGETIAVQGDVKSFQETVLLLWDYGEDGTVKRQLLRMYASGTTNTQDEDYLPLIDGHAKYTPSRGERRNSAGRR